ncbi:Zn(II)2Cys6 transcription factor [Aspergillus ibericus CBS 121593]|uniref:Zn(II)2Cys6 transcription factor n=1 Tax=Aspergillus ibericus CBS 121593 TaxID=1448316 RepID=A0A395GUI4_9EURO|nr:Zn(II)2Cys6 transcription factor [Aspergillus ibericus CBS 121593]RAK99089.1 Zn(II)2Cys6 transcription factor [Aspergillus ibericus CBS 121593]
MWSSAPRLLLGLYGLLSAVGSARADVDFMSVRPSMVKEYTGTGGEPGEKYFKESSFHYHYDGRFADGPLPEDKTVPHLSELIRTYLSTMGDLGVETWIMHGTLLAWWWNQKIFPWDNDLDVQISEPTIHFLADYYNMTEHHFDIPGVEGGRTYLLEINPNYVVRSTDDKLNVIDARWIDTSSGLFIDITAVRKDDERRAHGDPGSLMCKDGHRFDETEIFPLRNSYFEDVPVKIPFEYVRLLKKEYGSKSMTASVFQGYHFNQVTQVWDRMNLSSAPSSLSPRNGSDVVPGPHTTLNSHAVSHSSQDSLRSCITCRRRKVRCNKKTPCSNCVKAGIQCIFPPPGRAPRKIKRPQDAELLSRLRRLEGVIEHLSEKKTNSVAPSSETPSPRVQQQTENPPAPAVLPQAPQHTGDADGCPLLLDASKLDPAVPIAQRNVEHEFGRLVIEEGRSRYIEELQDILDPSSSDEEDYPSPETSSSHSTNHDGFLFGFYSVSHSLHEFLPSKSQIPTLWSIWMDNVAPLIPIVHKASAQQLFSTAARDASSLDKNYEALFLAMCLVSIVSLSPEQCSLRLGEERDAAVKRYRFAVEQALAKADLLNTQNFTLLQALVIFLLGIRREDDTKFVWSMTALVLRLAQGLGLHRDGTNFGLKPFETEMRRRLWWHICLLDIRSAEDHGSDAQIHERLYDTRLPLNINDEDITPDMQEPPQEHVGWTEMTFCLIRCDIAVAVRRVSYACPNGRFAAAARHIDPDNCARLIRSINDRIEDRYIKHCDMNIPIQWVCATIGRLILTKLWLVIHHPMTRPERGLKLSHANRESLFATSVEVVEFQRLLDGDVKTYKWSWLFATNMQWHAIAFVLSELCVRPLSPLTDRAWKAVSTLYTEWIKNSKQRKGMLWRPLSRLMKRATAFRAKQEEMQAQMSSSMGAVQDIAFTGHCGPVVPRALAFQPSPTSLNDSGTLADTGGVDFDLRKGPMGVIEELFPDTDWLNPATAASLQQPTNTGTDTSMDVLVRPMEPETQPGMPNGNLNWEEWDQVMTDFQTDLHAANTQNPYGNVLDWLA